MPFNIHFTKALVLTGLLGLVAMLTFNKIIRNNRLELFLKYSHLVLPPDYEIKQNAAGTSNYRTDVILVFAFDKKNYDLLIRQNKVENGLANRQNNWNKQGTSLIRKINIDAKTTVLETIYPRQRQLAFRYQQE